MGTLDVVAEGEECVRTQAHSRVTGYPFLLFLQSEHFRLLRKELLPYAVGKHVVVVFRNVNVNGIVTVGTTNSLHKRQGHHLRMLTEPPDVGLLTGKTGAVNAALLSGTNADGLAVLDIAYRVRLCILQGNQRNHQVATGGLREILGLGRHIFKKAVCREVYLIAALLESDAKYLLAFDGGRHIVGVDANDIISTLTLGLEDFKRFFGEGGSNDTVGNLGLDEQCRITVADIAQGNEITVRAHAVGTTGTGIGTGLGTHLCP